MRLSKGYPQNLWITLWIDVCRPQLRLMLIDFVAGQAYCDENLLLYNTMVYKFNGSMGKIVLA